MKPPNSGEADKTASYAGHPHYVSVEKDANGRPVWEIFYEDGEYHVGNTSIYTDYRHANRKLISSDTVMEDIYVGLGRPPCAEELSRWAIKDFTTDYIYEYSFEKNLQVYCTSIELPQERLKSS